MKIKGGAIKMADFSTFLAEQAKTGGKNLHLE